MENANLLHCDNISMDCIGLQQCLCDGYMENILIGIRGSFPLNVYYISQGCNMHCPRRVNELPYFHGEDYLLVFPIQI